MPKDVLYTPRIAVLHVEDNPDIFNPFLKGLYARGIFAHHVSSFEEAVEILRTCTVDICVLDGIFPKKRGEESSRNFIPLVEYIEKRYKNTKIIAWSNSTHVHTYCKKNAIEAYSKIALTKSIFTAKKRKYIPTTIQTSATMVSVIEKTLLTAHNFQKIFLKRKFIEVYKEYATILGIYMGMDTRLQMMPQITKQNSLCVITRLQDNLFTISQEAYAAKKVALSILHRIHKEPSFFPKVKYEVNKRANMLSRFSKKIQHIDFSKYSNAQLAKTYISFVKHFMRMRMYSSLPTELEHTFNLWTLFLTKQLKKSHVPIDQINYVLSTLTTPEKASYLHEFDIALAHMGIAKQQGKSITALLNECQSKYPWINYTFTGTPLQITDLQLRIKKMGKTKVDFINILEKEKTRVQVLKKQKSSLEKKYHLTREQLKWFAIGADIVYIKFFRKGIFAEAYYSIENLLEEIGKRIGCTKNEASNLLAGEILAALILGVFPAACVRARMKDSMLCSDNDHSYILPSEYADKVFPKKNTVVLRQPLKGQAAFVGVVQGRVCIVNTPEEMSKLKQGDVLVSRLTNPSLLPAMKLASAFVTDTGGLTCHAAIVARELQKPCLVGTGNATEVFTDGDMVEVDTSRGIISFVEK